MLRSLREYWIIKFSGLFDPFYYLSNYSDVRRADVDPLMHFVTHGWKEGRDPSLRFNTQFYLDVNPDVRMANVNPLVHYIRYGRKEGRKSVPNGEESSFIRSEVVVQKETFFNKLFSLDYLRKSFSYMKMYGVIAFLRKVKSVMASKHHLAESMQADIPIFVPSSFTFSAEESEKDLKEYSEKISIIIPTKNAGTGFEHLLKVLRNQKGFKKLEIVIVDSGSTDDTLLIAKAQKAKIINILPEEFSHSYARNLGAENASGDYFFFTVQDALPPTENWLYELLNAYFLNDVSAVSCAEFPREDADLFYRMLCWNHYNFLDVNGKDKIFKLPSHPDYMSLRQNGQLSDLACLISRKTFMEYKYRHNYAEDLDLGIRLIKDGKKIAFLGSTRIIHSHNRPASYFIKRGYVDNLFLSNMFNDFPVPRINIYDLIPDIAFTYRLVNEKVIPELSNRSLFNDGKAIETTFRETLVSANNYAYPSKEDIKEFRYVDSAYPELLESIFGIVDDLKSGESYQGFLVNALLDYSNVMFGYLKNSYENFGEELIEDIKRCVNKELAQLIGAHLAYCYIKASQADKEKIDPIHTSLKRGV